MNVLSLCDGMSCGQIALKELGIPVEHYYASEIDKNAIKVTMDNFPDTIQLGDVTQLTSEKLAKLPKIHLVIFGSPCFTEDTLVLTTEGYKKIVDIKVGDYVLAHDNQFHKVIDWMDNGIKEVYEVDAITTGVIKTTANHKFYIRTRYREWDSSAKKDIRKFKAPEWKKVSNLSKDDYFGYAINQNSIIPEWNGVDYWKQWHIHHKCELDMSNPDLWYLVGRWLGDGWLRKNRPGKYRNKYNGFIICCAHNQVDYLEEKMSKCFNFTNVKERTVNKLQVSSTEMATFLAQFGDGAKNKFIPGFVFDMPTNLLKELINGYFDSDGHYDKKRDMFICSSISNKLIYGIGQCIAKVYHRPFSIRYVKTSDKHVIEGRVVNQNDRYILTYKKEKGSQDKAFYEDGYIWYPLRRITKLGDENVYDITVEDAHSFTANGAIVHNCRSLSKATAGRKEYNNGLRGVSWLFYPCVDILNWIKENNNPNVYFMVENVDSNNKTDLSEMSSLLGVDPVLIDSNLFTAQDRKRNYWTNIPIAPLPESCDTVLKDIMDSDVPESFYYTQEFEYHGDDKKVCATLHINGHDILKRVNNKEFKSPTLTSCRGGNLQKKVFDNGRCRKLTPNEYRKLQGIPDWYKMDVANSHIYNMCGDGWTVPVIMHIFKGMEV